MKAEALAYATVYDSSGDVPERGEFLYWTAASSEAAVLLYIYKAARASRFAFSNRWSFIMILSI